MPSIYRSEREFAVLMAAVALVIVLWRRFSGGALAWPWLLLALLLLLVAWRAPRRLTPLARGWLRLGHLLGHINTRIILGLVFFLLITPLALLMRLFGRDALRLKRTAARSYWLRREQRWPPESFPESFKDQF